ncbi:MAG TPA: 4-(cytidine 5'-diphospho)-2-C-methyl-D-erythritol kinase [Armatimonadota bacterium]|jgi:4-diphosphocytidyl-2-C-methyl-D-erythritol kinase
MENYDPHCAEVQTYAKLNLTLEVLHRRPDQFHELRSVVQTVSLADRLTVKPGLQGTKLRLSGFPVPGGDDNLAMVAIRQAAARLGISRDLELSLQKNIPAGRGLGGGSSNAAGVLQALACVYGWRLNPDGLASIAAELGCDVPLFLHGGTLLMSGRGESLQFLGQDPAPVNFVVTWPEVGVPTEMAYSLLEPDQDFTDGERTRQLWEYLQTGQPPRAEMTYNCFQRVVFRRWPEVAALHDRLSQLAGAPACLTGSGSALFVITDHADEVAANLRSEGRAAHVVSPTPYGQLLQCRPLEEDENV